MAKRACLRALRALTHRRLAELLLFVPGVVSVQDKAGNVAVWNDLEQLKGVPSSRVFRHRKQFELTVDRLLGEQVRADGEAAVDLWCAITNVEWVAPDGTIVSYTQRTAGALVAWIREEGDYLEWYCSGVAGHVASWIETPLVGEGWTWRPM